MKNKRTLKFLRLFLSLILCLILSASPFQMISCAYAANGGESEEDEIDEDETTDDEEIDEEETDDEETDDEAAEEEDSEADE